MKRILTVFLVLAITGVGIWAGVRYFRPKRQLRSITYSSSGATRTRVYGWEEAVAKVKEPRVDGGGVVETPPELRHYDDRHWFLAAQVAEVAKHNIDTCEDFIDLAAMIERGEIVPVPAVTETYVLYGVGQRADDSVFSRYEGDHNVEIYTDAQLSEEYKKLSDRRASLQADIASLKSQVRSLKKNERSRQRELQNQISSQEQELKSLDDDKTQLDQSYGDPNSRQQLMRDYESLQSLAKNFAGRSYNLDDPSDRQALKINMLQSLRPQALKVMEEIADAYHRQFDRPLPVSSLVRPEQYQRALRRVNRNAVLIETPPHTTGLAFDIDYRYMSPAEQTFVMKELARLEQDGRIEVIRESNANYHVFAFLNGTRPSDDLIAASLQKASEQPVVDTHHAASKAPAKMKSKSAKSRARATKAKSKSKSKPVRQRARRRR